MEIFIAAVIASGLVMLVLAIIMASAFGTLYLIDKNPKVGIIVAILLFWLWTSLVVALSFSDPSFDFYPFTVLRG